MNGAEPIEGAMAQPCEFAAVRARSRSRVLKLTGAAPGSFGRALFWLVALASAATITIVAAEVARPPVRALEVTGVREVVPPDFAAIDGVLKLRGPGLGLTLRRQLAIAISEESARAGFDPLLVLAVIDVESDFREGAISNAGARGLMQIRPATLAYLAEKEGLTLSREEIEHDTALQVRLGVRYLKSLYDRFGDLSLALMAYNCGPNRLLEALKTHELDAYRGYAQAVTAEYANLRRTESLGDGWAARPVSLPRRR